MPFTLVPLSQQNPKWKDIKLGFSNYTLGTSGCALTSVCMLLSGHGYPETPDSFNTKMKNNGGFLDAAIVWSAVSSVYPKVKFKDMVICTDAEAPLARIDASISAGQPVIVQVDSSPSAGLQTHWVVLYAKKGSDYLMLDPYPNPSDKGDTLLMPRYAHGKTLQRAISAVIWYECTASGTGTTTAPTTSTTVPTDGYYVRVQSTLASPGLRLRSQATTISDTLAFEEPSTLLKVLETEATAKPKVGVFDQWLRVRDASAREGYVAAWYVEAATSSSAGTPAPVAPYSGTINRTRKSIGAGLENVPLAPNASQALKSQPPFSPLQQEVLNIWNKYGNLILALSNNLGIDLAAALATLKVESGGAGFDSSGRMIIRFENHIFYNYWGKNNLTKFNQHFMFDPKVTYTGHQWRPNPTDAWRTFHDNNATEWQVLNFASTLDDSAAKMSISMGSAQIMGFNFADLGYSSVQDMFNAFSNERDQIFGFFEFVAARSGALNALKSKDFRTFATYYNGSGQPDYYGGLIKSAYDAFNALRGSQTLSVVTTATPVAVPAPTPSTPTPTTPTPPPASGFTIPNQQDLVTAINKARTDRGIAAYKVHPILMSNAQKHAEYMASSGEMSHLSADGSRPFQRHLAAGYPLAGDLTLGGFASENICGGSQMTIDEAITFWFGDDPHTNTMLGDKYNDCGAGVAVAGDWVYYCFDVAKSTTAAPTPSAPKPAEPVDPSAFYVYVPGNMASGVRIRKEGSMAGVLIRVANAGERLTSLETNSATAKAKVGVQDQWLKVRDSLGNEGYVAAWLISAQQTPVTVAPVTPAPVTPPTTTTTPPKPATTTPAPVTPQPAPITPPPAPVTPPPVVTTPAEVVTTGEFILMVSQSVGTSGLRLRQTPSPAGVFITVEPAGTKLTVLEKEATARLKLGKATEWFKVRDPQRREGYVSAGYVEEFKPPVSFSLPDDGNVSFDVSDFTVAPEEPTLNIFVSSLVTGNGLSLRVAPSLTAGMLKSLPIGTTLAVLDPEDEATIKIGRYSNWIRVREPLGLEGYVAAWLVHL